jgi:hypothetical protein
LRPVRKGRSRSRIRINVQHDCRNGDINSKLEDEEFTEQTRVAIERVIADEDTWMVKAQQRELGGDFWIRRPALLPQHRTTTLCRRRGKQLVSAQAKSADPK